MDGFLFHTSVRDAVREFDRYLNKTYLETLSIDEARLLLARIETFNRLAERWRMGRSFSGEEERIEEEYLIAACCRLTSDLSEKILVRLMDILQDRETELELLSSKVRRKLHERLQVSTLLRQAQTVRATTNTLGEVNGLGMIL